MIIYHGSTLPVIEPRILKSGRMLDFGTGFYTTSNKEQAKRWARLVANKRKTDDYVITEYDFNFNAAAKELSIISLKYCRYVRYSKIGGTANGKE